MYSGVHAQSSPRVMSYQGVLRPAGSASGNQTAGMRLLTVTIYGDANGTVKLWQGAMNTLIDSSGVFNCMVGTADNPLPSPAVMDQPLWLGVAVDGGTELRPLSQMAASPFALNVADSSITASKLNMNYISTISVNGTPVTGKGTNLNIVAGDGVNAIWVPSESTLTLSGTGGGGGGMKTMSLSDSNWSIGGNNGTSVPSNFIGTGDATSGFEIHLEDSGTAADNTRVAHFEFNSSSPMITMGYGAGSATGNGIAGEGSTIAGGGSSGFTNSIDGTYCFIGGGEGNKIYFGGDDNSVIGCTITGGYQNTVFGPLGTIGGGQMNLVGADYSCIGGGLADTILGEACAIAGGSQNRIGYKEIQDDGVIGSFIGAGLYDTIDIDYGTLCGGFRNVIDSFSDYSSIGGGQFNSIKPFAVNSGIASGDSNRIDSGAAYSTVGGGLQNLVQAPWSSNWGWRRKYDRHDFSLCGYFGWPSKQNPAKRQIFSHWRWLWQYDNG